MPKLTLLPRRAPRLTGWLLISIVLASVVYLTMPLDPQPSRWSRFLVALNKVNLVGMGGWIAYWLDRGIFPYARPDKFLRDMENAQYELIVERLERHFQMACMRRAVIIAAGMIAVALGT